MKKRFAFLLSIIILCSTTSCENIEKDHLAYALENSQYVLSPKTCRTFMGTTPEDASRALTDSYWVEGHFQSAIEDEDGNLVLTLSEEDIEHWSNYINQLIAKRSELDASEGYQFIVSNDYKSIESHTSKQVHLAAGYNLIDISLFCGIMQMLNGDNPNDWYVDIRMIDVETGILIAEARLPEDRIEVNDEDWDRALNAAENGSAIEQ